MDRARRPVPLEHLRNPRRSLCREPVPQLVQPQRGRGRIRLPGVSNTVLAGSHFEANGTIGDWDHVPIKPTVLGAVRCHTGATNNTVETCALINSTDTVIDEADGNNVCTS